MRVRLMVNTWRHASKAIYHKYIDNKAVVKAFIKNNKNMDEKDEAFDIQTKHSF